VNAVRVRRGDVLKKDQLIAKLDDELARATRAARAGEAEAARAQVKLLQAGPRSEEVGSLAARVKAASAVEAQLKRNLDRERELNRRGVTASAAVDDLESQLQRATAERQSLEQSLNALRRGARTQEIATAEARADAARSVAQLEDARVERHELHADAPATVLDIHVDPGEIVAAGSPVVTLANTHQPYADVFVPEAKIGGIRVGAVAKVRVDSLSEPLNAKVESIGHKTEFTPRFLFSDRERPNLVIRVRVRIEDDAEKLHAGLPAFVSVERQP
jgi:HlyD family secretion protein